MSDFTEAIKKLFPQGMAWNDNPIKDLAVKSFATVLEALDMEAKALFLERFTLKQKSSLDDWEYQLGLPDEFSNNEGIANRKKAVIAKRAAIGGQSESSFHELATSYGFKIRITKYPSFIVGLHGCGDNVDGEPFEATITITDYSIERMRAGEYEIGTQQHLEEQLLSFIGRCKQKVAAYGKLYFLTEV